MQNKNFQALTLVGGIAGIYQKEGMQAADELYLALHNMNQRGPDVCGIACSTPEKITACKGAGMLSEVITDLSALKGSIAVGQISKTGTYHLSDQQIQPVMVRAHQGHFAIVTTGRILNAAQIKEELEEEGLIFRSDDDGELIAHLIQKNSGHLFEKISGALERLQGAFAFLLMTKSTLYAYRSAAGIQPLFQADIDKGCIFATETSAFSIVQADNIREVQPGHLIRVGKNQVLERELAPAGGPGVCGMEFVYYARPDSQLHNCNVHALRRECGRLLALHEDVQADVVMGVPDTAICAAMGFAQQLSLPYDIGLIKNRYIGSTFVQPSQIQRQQGMRVRLNAIPATCKGKRILLVDDSLCRGATAKRLCQLLKEAGASEVHLRIASPKITQVCRYGYNDAGKDELAANLYNEEEMQERYGLDSIRFLELEDFLKAAGSVCSACMERND